MKTYEIMYIIKSDVSDELLKETVKKYEKLLSDFGANITLSKEMGHREFAYEIKKYKSGYYYLYNLTANNDKAIKEFDRVAGFDENILRHLVLNLDK